MIIFPKKTTFETPEGDYRAVVRDAFEMADGSLRIVFELLSLKSNIITYLAGKNYAPGKQSIADDLFEWLGLRGLQTLIKEDGSIDVAKLKGLQADKRSLVLRRLMVCASASCPSSSTVTSSFIATGVLNRPSSWPTRILLPSIFKNEGPMSRLSDKSLVTGILSAAARLVEHADGGVKL